MAKNTIKLKKYVDINVEYQAAAALSPGHLIELNSAGKVQKHASDAGTVLPMFALEDELRGRTIEQAFEENDPVQCWVAVRGEEVYAILDHGENAVIGSLLASAGNGALKVFDEESAMSWVDRQNVVGIALEAVDFSHSTADGYEESADAYEGGRIKIRII